jgi:hypothetical protein
MCKKVIVGVVVAIAALVAIKGTWLGSHFRLWAKQTAAEARERVSPEREIERLRMELSGLKSQDERFIDKVARQALAMEKLEGQTAGLKKDLARREKDLKEMHAVLAKKDAQVVFHGERYPREKVAEQLKLDFVSFEADEQVLESREAHLAEMRKSVTLNRRKLSELRVQRERMATELQRLETALAEERRTQAEQSRSLDDASYRRLTDEIAAVKERIELLKKKRELRGEVIDGPVRAAEQQREEDAKLRARMTQRLGDAE